MGPIVDLRLKSPDLESQCSRLNVKSWQLNTAHELSNVMQVESLVPLCDEHARHDASTCSCILCKYEG